MFDIAEILDLHRKKLVKVRAKLMKIDGEVNRRESFTLDPLTVNYSNLRYQIARIFQIDGEFSIDFKKDGNYMSLISDWDLDGAISECSKPYMSLSIKLQPIDKTLEEWDIICPSDIPDEMDNEATRCSEDRKSLAGSIISQIEYTMQKVQKALSFDFSSSADCDRVPTLDFDEYSNLLDPEGVVINPQALHKAVFRGGVDPPLRPVVWKHLLNVYPPEMSEREREAYMSQKCEEYYQLRHRWQHLMGAGTIPEVLQGITTMVRKDVRRTDRTEKFFSGAEDSGSVRSLFNILVTYAVNHPGTSYCQGMSDLLSPLLYVMRKEAEAYVCFCGLMRRTEAHFRLDGRSMKTKFRHLQKMIRFYDPELYIYLKNEDALDLLFCYRWLLLDLKREFPFKEMLALMEIMWASMPPKPPQQGIKLYDVKFPTVEICNSLKDRTTEKDYFKVKEDHFGASIDGMTFSHSEANSEKRFETLEKIKKWTSRVRRQSMIPDSPKDENEINLPVHYRKRKYRQYIPGKLGRLDRGEELAVRSYKMIPTRGHHSSRVEICQSWSCGEVFEEKPQMRDALYDAREFLRNQWCYSNTVNEIQLNNWLNHGRRQLKTSCSLKETEDVWKQLKTDLCGCSSSSVKTTDGNWKGKSNCKDDLCDCSLKTTKTNDEDECRKRHGSSDSNYSTISDACSDYIGGKVSPSGSSEGYESDVDLKGDEYDDEYDEDEYSDEEDEDFVDSMAGRQYEEVETYFERKRDMLPPPHELGDSNPFLLFLCLEIIISHKEEIVRRRLDFNELGIYFDRMVRKHRLVKVLPNAQRRFREYLNMQWDVEEPGDVSQDER